MASIKSVTCPSDLLYFCVDKLCVFLRTDQDHIVGYIPTLSRKYPLVI